MSNKHPRAAELLPVLAQAFPHTFFAEPRQVQPLKVNIHQDLYAALPAGINPAQTNRFLAWYVHRLAYLKALAAGQGRVDLTGAVVESEIPEPIRQQPGNAGSSRNRPWRPARAEPPASLTPLENPALPPPRPALPYRRCRSTWRSFNNDWVVLHKQ